MTNATKSNLKIAAAIAAGAVLIAAAVAYSVWTRPAPSVDPVALASAARAKEVAAARRQVSAAAQAEAEAKRQAYLATLPPWHHDDDTADVCRGFQALMKDVLDGVLTVGEIRTEAIRLDHIGRTSTTPGVPQAVRGLVAASTPPVHSGYFALQTQAVNTLCVEYWTGERLRNGR